MNALGGLHVVNGDVNAPGAEGVRDYMLRYMGQTFVGAALGPGFGDAFGIIVSVVFALLLFSAVNTSLVSLINLQFLLARDREFPKVFQRLNKWSAQSLALLMSRVLSVLLFLLVQYRSGLTHLYT